MNEYCGSVVRPLPPESRLKLDYCTNPVLIWSKQLNCTRESKGE